MIDVHKMLIEKILSERRHNTTLIFTAISKDGCFKKYNDKKEICNTCLNKVEKYMKSLKSESSDGMRIIYTLFGNAGIFRGGRRFILNVPSISFRALGKNKDLLKAYRMIVKQKMNKNIKEHNGEILLYLNFNIKDRYSSIDCDNIIKSLQDALQGILYKNDSQIKCIIAEKNKVTNNLQEKNNYRNQKH